jgi:acyl carrier protein
MEPQKVRSQLEAEVRKQLSQSLHLPPGQIDLRQSVQSLGLDSFQAAILNFYVEDNFGVELDPEMFYADITFEQFIAQVVDKAGYKVCAQKLSDR